VTAEAIAGGGTGVRLNGPLPHEVVVADSVTAQSSWDDEYVMTPLPPLVGGVARDSVRYPVLARDPGAGAGLRHVSLQLPLVPSGANRCDDMGPGFRRVVYRAASSAGVLTENTGTPERFVVATGAVDHPSLVMTLTGTGARTAHVAYNVDGSPSTVRYWRYEQSTTPVDVAVPGLAGRRAEIARGQGADVYAWGQSDTAMPTICPMSPSGTCVSVPGGALSVYAPFIRFGPIEAAPVAPGTGFGTRCKADSAGSTVRRCFGTRNPIAVYFDRTQTNHVYVAWQAEDPDAAEDPVAERKASSIYVTRSVNGAFGMWSSPLRVHPRDTPTMHYFDPAITVDDAGTVIVTFSLMEQDQLYPVAYTRIAYRPRGTGPFVVLPTLFAWYPNRLPVDCLTNEFYLLGERTLGDVFGGRAFHPIRRDPSDYSTEFAGVSASLWSIL
jgi:hypothetical protein